MGEAEELLDILQATEIRFGRVRHEKWGPRTLDLDLIYSDDKSCCTDRLTLPHPYFWERLFVLVPLEELSPDFFGKGSQSITELLFGGRSNNYKVVSSMVKKSILSVPWQRTLRNSPARKNCWVYFRYRHHL